MRRGDRVSLASDSTTEALVVKILGHDMVRVFWRRHPTHAGRLTCGREVALMRFRASDLHPHGWQPVQDPSTSRTGAGCTTESPGAVGRGRWHLVPIWDPARQSA